MDDTKKPLADPKINDHISIHHREKPKNNLGMYIGAVVIAVAGIISGYFLAQPGTTKTEGPGNTIISSDGKIVGAEDTSMFKDSSEGTLEAGGINGEGTHKLIRPGGDSQTIYMTSTVIDLDIYVGKKVRVWGETQAAQTAGWFMDVGRLEILE